MTGARIPIRHSHINMQGKPLRSTPLTSDEAEDKMLVCLRGRGPLPTEHVAVLPHKEISER